MDRLGAQVWHRLLSTMHKARGSIQEERKRKGEGKEEMKERRVERREEEVREGRKGGFPLPQPLT